MVPWEGFWQVLPSSIDEKIVPFLSTTTALRSHHGFIVYTKNRFMELRYVAMAHPPKSWPPTHLETMAMFRAFRAATGRCSWEETDRGWKVWHRIQLAGDPRLEGVAFEREFMFDRDFCRCKASFGPNGHHQRRLGAPLKETWRRLSPGGRTPLSGAWQCENQDELWIYLVTAGHYGVMRANIDRPKAPAHGDEFSDAEVLALAQAFSANAGARLETDSSFEHWPMIASTAGFEVRKHETFHLEQIEPHRFTATLPPYEGAGDEWHRID